MQKENVLGIIGAAIGISVLDAHLRTRAAEKLRSSITQKWMNIAHENWRRGYLEGFEECNRRLHYPIPRSEYPTFE